MKFERFFTTIYQTTYVFLALVFLACACQIASGQSVESSGSQSVPAEPSESSVAKRAKFEELVANSIRHIGALQQPDITESSGLAAAALDDAYWTINDSGGSSEIFLFEKTGEHLARVRLARTKNRDWEALASYNDGQNHWLVVADVGDNLSQTGQYELYVFVDPSQGRDRESLNNLAPVQPVRLSFVYADDQSVDISGSKPGKKVGRNCEAVAVDPRTGDIWLTEKIYLEANRKRCPGVFVLPAPWPKVSALMNRRPENRDAANFKKSLSPMVATRIGSSTTRNVTGMAFSADGKKLIIRSYLIAELFSRAASETWVESVDRQLAAGHSGPRVVALPLQIQGEAVCFTSDSNALVVTSEGKRQPIWQIDLQAYVDESLSVVPQSSP